MQGLGVSLFRMLSAFRDDRRGVGVIEFAMVAPIFIFMMMMTIEGGIFFYKKNHLKWVLYESSRHLQTGIVQRSDDKREAFEEKVCSHANVIFDCEKIYFDVRSFSSISSVDLPEPLFSDAGRPLNFVFEPGGPEAISTVRLATPHQFVTPMVHRLFQRDGKPVISTALSIAKNEPFQR